MPRKRTKLVPAPRTNQVFVKFIGETVIHRVGGRKELIFNQGVTLLIGPNGCGKTTTLQALRGKYNLVGRDKKGNALTAQCFQSCGQKSIKIRGYDFVEEEKFQDNLALKWAMWSSSHGQFNRKAIEAIMKGGDDLIIVLDEPENGLDAEGLMLFKKTLLESKALFIIIATHSPILICDPRFNVLEMVPGYRKIVFKTLQGLIG